MVSQYQLMQLILISINTYPAKYVALSFLVLTVLQYLLFLRVKSESAQPADSFYTYWVHA